MLGKSKFSVVAFFFSALLLAISPAAASIGRGDGRVSLEEAVPALGEEKTQLDRLPRNIDVAVIRGIRLDSVRSLGSDGVGKYWVARSGSSSICVILRIIGGAQVTASSCGPIAEFYRQGIPIAAGEAMDRPELSVQAYLLPSDVEVSDVLPKVANRAEVTSQSNLITARWYGGPLLSEVTVKRTGRQSFRFRPIERVGDSGE